MQLILFSILWISLGLVAYAYVGYPITIFFCSLAFGRRRSPSALLEAELPSINLIVVAHNERSVIAERIENALELDYPSEKLKITVASDGSNDGTDDIVRGYSSRGVSLLSFPQRRGKSVVVNDSIKAAKGEILILSDANTMMEPTAARKLVRWFTDPSVGAVCGWLNLTDAETGQNADGAYWRYENFLKRCEGRLDAVLGANGAIYALRRSIFRPIPTDTLIDDLTIPLLAKMHNGCRIVYDKEAVANEETAPDISAEFRRRARIGTGGFQAISRLWPLLHPKFGWTAFAFFSHKVLRWASPFFLVALFVSNLLLVTLPAYNLLFTLQLLFYGLAVIGSQLTLPGSLGRVCRLPALFATVNAALLVGFFRWIAKPQSGVWVRTQRAT